MNLFIYTDESGVFDKTHNKYFVFGGVLFLSKEDKDIENRKFIHVEKTICKGYDCELKASIISNEHKGKIFRSLNNVVRFGVVIDQNRIKETIFLNKKSKQRYLDYAYKIMLKNTLNKLSRQGKLDLSAIKNIYIYCDEHTTATNGRYELREGILEEFKFGTHNFKWDTFYEPICPQVGSIDVKFCDSKVVTLIRAADIVANKIYFHATKNTLNEMNDKVIIKTLP